MSAGRLGVWAVSLLPALMRYGFSFGSTVPFDRNELDRAVTLWISNRSSAESQYGSMRLWDTSGIVDMSKLFEGKTRFNEPIGTWNTTSVQNMDMMFKDALEFNQPIGNWNTARVTTMKKMFEAASRFNQPIGNWDTARVVDMEQLFKHAFLFNQPIETWDTGRVTNMKKMFKEASRFSHPLGNWNTARVTAMKEMFEAASRFNQPIGNWNTARVTKMSKMFADAHNFNQPLESWDVGSVTDNITSIFKGALKFCQDVTLWHISWQQFSTGMQFSFHQCWMGPTTTAITTTRTSTTAAPATISATTIPPNMSSTTTPRGSIAGVQKLLTCTGSFQVVVSNVADFVRETSLHLVLRQSVAILADVRPHWVTILNVTLNSTNVIMTRQRLLLTLVTGQYLDVSWRIDLDPAAPQTVTATIIAQRYNGKTLKQANQDMNRALALAVAMGLLDRNYTAQVKWKFAEAVGTNSPSVLHSGSTSRRSTTGLIVIVVMCNLFALCLCMLLCYRVRRFWRAGRGDSKEKILDAPGRQESLNFFAKCPFIHFLGPPQVISQADGETMLQFAQTMVPGKVHKTKVFLAFAIGHHPSDAADFGPGMYHAIAVLKYLQDNGVGCFSSLMLRDGVDEDHFVLS